MGRKITKEEIRKTLEDKGCELITKKEKILNLDKIEIQCPCGEIYETTYSSFVHQNKTKCNKCTNFVRKHDIESVIEKVKQAGYIFVSIEGEYIDNDCKNLTVTDEYGFLYLCSFGQIGRAINSGGGLKMFYKSNAYSINNLYNFVKINKKPYHILSSVYTGYKDRNIELKCVYCEKTWLAQPRDIVIGGGCIHCNMSKGELKITSVLMSFGFIEGKDFIRQAVFDNCKKDRNLSFDFYLPNYNLCIEYDGILHFVDKFNNSKEFKLVQKRDKIKNEYCKDNEINLLRIPYWDFDNIEKILEETLFQ